MIWYENYKWKSNPFLIDPIPDTFIIEDIRSKVEQAIYSGDILNLYGQTGTGKTSLLRALKESLKDKFTPVYIDPLLLSNYAPKNTPSDKRQYEGFLVKLSRDALKSPLAGLRSILGTTMFDNLEATYKDRKLVLLVDEAKDVTDPTIPAYFRSIKNSGIDCSIIITSIEPLSNMKVFGDSLRDVRVSFLEMRTVSEEEAKQILQKRIEKVGGNGMDPFNDQALKYLITESGNTPILILKNAEDVLKYLSFKNIPNEVTIENISQALLESSPKSTVAEIKIEGPKTLTSTSPESSVSRTSVPFENLTDTQKEIVNALRNGPLTSVELCKLLGVEQAALFTNLYRLMLRRDVERMKNKGIVKPVISMSDEKPAKFVLSAEWKLGLVKE